MSDKDQAEIDAERLLPCCGQGWITDNEQLCPPELPSCVVCTKRAAVAAELRELLERLAAANAAREDAAAIGHERIVALEAEIAVRDNQITQLLASNDKWVVEIERLKNGTGKS